MAKEQVRAARKTRGLHDASGRNDQYFGAASGLVNALQTLTGIDINGGGLAEKDEGEDRGHRLRFEINRLRDWQIRKIKVHNTCVDART